MAAESKQRIEALYRTFGPVVYRRCLRLLRDRARAARATEAVFVKLLRDASRFEDPAAALPWIHDEASKHCTGLPPAERTPLEPLEERSAEEPGDAVDLALHRP